MGYYYFDEQGKRHWVDDPNDMEGDDPITWKSIGLVCVIIFVTWLVSFLLTGCASKKAVTVEKDSVAVVDSVRHSAVVRDSSDARHTEAVAQRDVRWVTDSTVITYGKETVCTLMVDTAGRVISSNTVTTINRDRDHFRDLTQKVDNTRTVTDSLTAVHSEARGDTALHNGTALHSSDKQTTVTEKTSWWTRFKAWGDGIGIGVLLAVFGFIAWKIYKEVKG